MPTHTETPIPAHRIAAARDTILITPGQHFHLGVAQAAWSDLKEARGQQVNFARLAPAHIIEAESTPLVAALDAGRARTSAVVRALRAAREAISYPDLGGAA